MMEGVFVSVQGMHAVLRCYWHPQWIPQITGDRIAVIQEKIDRHLELDHAGTWYNQFIPGP